MHEHELTHTHEHTHENGVTHTHEHTHEHEHTHTHARDDVPAAERTRALLGYMIEHNEHHAEELAELVDTLDGAAHKKLLEAIGSFEAGNVQLREVLELMEEA